VIRRIENGIEVSSSVSQRIRVLWDRDMVHRHDGAVVIGELVLWSIADGGRRQCAS
jgi:DNA integrity scanning protein DisA with diadenylate cyclase activity